MQQTAVEWLFSKLWDEPKDKFTWYALLEQTKQMEAEQNLQQYNEGYNKGRWHLVSDSITPKGHKIFEMYKEWEKSQDITLRAESESKAIPELSDEEIKNAGINNWNAESQSGLYVVAFIDGAKWYREQLKQRQ